MITGMGLMAWIAFSLPLIFIINGEVLLPASCMLEILIDL